MMSLIRTIGYAEVYRIFLIENLLPAINQKWPLHDRLNQIKIQQDNTKPQIAPTDESFLNAAYLKNNNNMCRV